MKVIQLSICCLLAAFFVVSCQKEELNVDQVALLESEGSYTSATLRGDSIDISLEERCMYGDTVQNLRRLPNVIFRYINANYDSRPSVAVVKNKKTIAVQLEDGTILLFSIKGRYIKECGERNPDTTLEERCMKGDTIQNLRRLPIAIIRYVNANYDADIDVAVVRPRKTITVQLTDGTILIFTIKGRYIKECGEGIPPRDSIRMPWRDSLKIDRSNLPPRIKRDR